MIQNKYTYEELFNSGPQKTYKGIYLNEISFPLGGIGTGSIGLTGRGSLKDFEIFNRPNIGSWFPKTFPMIQVKENINDPVCRILEGPIQRPYTPKDGGAFHCNGEGLPHMDRCEFRGEYPFAWIDFFCDKMPLKVQLEAYNPFIPSDADSSSFPAAILRYHITNISNKPVNVSILWSLFNMVGITKNTSEKIKISGTFDFTGKFINEYKKNEKIHGIFFRNQTYEPNHPLFGSMALTTPDKNISYIRYWKQAQWFTPQYTIWNTFKQTGKVIETKKKPRNKAEAGAIAISKTITPGDTKTYTFYITWYFPNFVKYWQTDLILNSIEGRPVWKNYYASLFQDAFDVADKLNKHEARLYEDSKRFHDVLFNSSYPPYVIDAIASNMSTLKTNTCLRLTDGSFYGWEGCSATAGWCEGSCTHVWGYQQTLPFLFPSLERSMHDLNYKYNFFYPNKGALGFRLQVPLGSTHPWKMPCADGQLGGIIHVYRDWKISGDDEWLKKIWPKVQLALEYVWEDWDKDKIGVLHGMQHNTYDVEFYGPNPMLTCYYLGALRAGSEIAKFMGENDKSKEYMEIYRKGKKWVDENLFNGEYYIQNYDPKHGKLNQIGSGCLIDQLIGQQLARITGLENFLDPANIVTTLKSIFKYNWKLNMREHENGARLYAVNDEAATVICTWPKGGRPEIPFTYADEVMNGFEYQFGIHCILEGLLEEGLIVIKSIRDRYDGYGRNPWDEFECGHHYARSMASYGALIALSGFVFDKGQGYIGFSPVINQNDFRTFWSLNGVWGLYSQNEKEICIEVLYGNIYLQQLRISQFAKNQNVELILPSKEFFVNFDEYGQLMLPEAIELEKNQKILLRKN